MSIYSTIDSINNRSLKLIDADKYSTFAFECLKWQIKPIE